MTTPTPGTPWQGPLVSVCSGCWNKALQTVWLMNNRRLLLIIPGSGSLRSGCQCGQASVLFWSQSSCCVIAWRKGGGIFKGTNANYEEAAQRPRFLTAPSWGLGFQHMHLGSGGQEHSGYNPLLLGSSSVKRSLGFFPSSGFHHSFMKGKDQETGPLAPVWPPVSVFMISVSIMMCDRNEDESGEIK